MKKGDTSGTRGKARVFTKKNRFYWLMGLFYIFCIAYIFYLDFTKIVFRKGFPAARTYIARLSFNCEDIAETEKIRDAVAKREPPVLRPVDGWLEYMLKPLKDLVKWAPNDDNQLTMSREQWRKNYRIPFPEDLAVFIKNEQKKYRVLYTRVKNILNRYENNVIPEKIANSFDIQVIRIIEMVQGKPKDRKEFPPALPTKTDVIIALEDELKKDTPPKVLASLLGVFEKRFKPSLVISESLTEEYKKQARNRVKPVFKAVKKGTVIISEGDVIADAVAVQIEAEQRAFSSSLTLSALVILTGLYLFLFEKTIRLTKGKLLLYFFFIVLFLFFIRILSFIGIPPNAVPIVFIGMVTAIIVHFRFAVIMVFILSFVTGYLFRVNVDHIVALFASGVTGIFFCRQLRRRISVLEGGLVAGLVNAAVIYGIGFSRNVAFNPIWLVGVAGLANGLGSGIILIGVLPLIEYIFDTTTDIRLLELSDQGHPLLRNLFLQASGTYTHSLSVGNLAENAADAIGANSLLARVASYYHDIGKIFKPEYFIENQTVGGNKHDKLKPGLSSLVIASHTRDGVELGEEYNLPQAILDITAQHHGTGKILFFLQKAQAMAGENEKIDEQYYRYPGPKPVTKEAGVVLLADSIEAASRTLTSPSPSGLRKTVERIVKDKIEDGQLDETTLTLVELNKIKESFISVLYGVFHARIEYPEEEQA
jgi:putative nucleotidyltransferase with HDIG domain